MAWCTLPLCLLGCSGTTDNPVSTSSAGAAMTGVPGGGGGGSNATPNGMAGSSAGGGGTHAGGAGSSGAPSGGVAPTDGGAAGGGIPAGGGGAAGGGGMPAMDPLPEKDFVCSEVVGLALTSQWYLAGFETSVNDARWQLKWAEHSYVDEWAKPDSPFWATPPVSRCAQKSTSPDRVVFVALSWTIMAKQDWQTALTSDVKNLKAKYADLRSIDLLTIVRGPGNQACGTQGYAESTKVPANLDAAIAEVASQFPGLVHVGPVIEATACSDFTGGGPHLTADGDKKLAGLYGAYYAKLP
jgi:hypothetical protein